MQSKVKLAKVGKISIVIKLLILAPLLTLVACSIDKTQPTVKVIADESLKFGFIAFGDSGYDVAYLKEKQYMPAVATLEEFVAIERADWLEDQRPANDFVAPPNQYIAEVNSFVESAGLYPVADAMYNYCANASCEFSVMLGDNVYPDGADASPADDKRFETLFSKPLSKLGERNASYKIYTALGNHDWDTSREGAMAQVKFMENTKPFYMDGVFYKVKPPAAKGEVEIFVIDTEIILSSTMVLETQLNPDGSEQSIDEIDMPEEWTKPQGEAEENIVAWLEQSLKNSTAKWKFVIGHHPIWSTGGTKYEQAKSLRKLLLPAMCRYADAYFSGHEHSLELHEDSCESVFGEGNGLPLLQIVSGAAAKQRAVNEPFKTFQDRNYPENNSIFTKGMIWGFSHIQLNGETATVDMISTPNSGTAETNLEYRHSFSRRSGSAASK
jgi:tartrate-resistant acid phosphatase type 5